MGRNACARACTCAFADSPAHHVVDQAFAHTIEFASAAFFHGDSIIHGDTYSAHGHAPCSNTCTAWGLAFDAWLASTEESYESAIRGRTFG